MAPRGQKSQVLKKYSNLVRGLWAPLAFVCAHALAIALSPAHERATASRVFQISAPLLAAFVAMRRCRAVGWRPSDGWSMVALAFSLWALGMMVPQLRDRTTTGSVLVDYSDILLFVMYAVPLTWIVATPFRHRDASAIQLVDGLLAFALGVLFFELTIVLIRQTADQDVALSWLFDVENVFLCVGLSARSWAASSAAERRLFQPLLVFALLYVVAAAYNNHITELSLHIDSGSYFDLIVPLPFVVFAEFVWTARAQPTAARRALARRTRYVRSASPWLLCVAVLGTGLALARYQYAAGAAGVLVAVAGYGLRNVVREVRHLELRARQRKQQLAVQELALTDALTGVANRRALDEAFEREWKRSLRSGRPLGVLLIDIDYFKLLNDTSGHQAGDQCLRSVALGLRRALQRPDDFLGRFGGEEFVALLPDTDEHGCERVAESLRQAVIDLQLSNAGAPSSKVTISIGAACEAPRPGRERADLLRAADEAVYAAKRGGRNRVCLAWLAPPAPQSVGHEAGTATQRL